VLFFSLHRKASRCFLYMLAGTLERLRISNLNGPRDAQEMPPRVCAIAAFLLSVTFTAARLNRAIKCRSVPAFHLPNLCFAHKNLFIGGFMSELVDFEDVERKK
jgi:hypothetical protein